MFTLCSLDPKMAAVVAFPTSLRSTRCARSTRAPTALSICVEDMVSLESLFCLYDSVLTRLAKCGIILRLVKACGLQRSFVTTCLRWLFGMRSRAVVHELEELFVCLYDAPVTNCHRSRRERCAYTSARSLPRRLPARGGSYKRNTAGVL